MGSGSDYSSFIQHLGVPALNLGYGGEDPGGEYHSIYDSYDDYRRFKDPSFEYGVALSKTAGHAALRLADADLLPFDFKNLSKVVNGYLSELIALTDQIRENTEIENELIKTKQYELANDPQKNLKIPVLKSEVPYLNFAPLQNALAALDKSAGAIASTWTKSLNTAADHDALNKALYRAEQQLLSTGGLPRRPWYRHTLYAPGFYTGYGVKTMPGIREAIEQRNWQEAQDQIIVDADAINKLATYLKNAAKQ